MTPPLSSPRDRSNFARKAAHARWSHSTSHCERSADALHPQAISPPDDPQTANNDLRTANCQPPTVKHKSRPTQRVDWLATRFCLRLEQDPTGAWFLRTPSGLSLPASPAEISLWLDLESLSSQLSNSENIIIS